MNIATIKDLKDVIAKYPDDMEVDFVLKSHDETIDDVWSTLDIKEIEVAYGDPFLWIGLVLLKEDAKRDLTTLNYLIKDVLDSVDENGEYE